MAKYLLSLYITLDEKVSAHTSAASQTASLITLGVQAEAGPF